MQGHEMERLCSLFFELSNEDRLRRILTLMDEPLKLTHIAKKLDLTAQECSRQLSRLTNIDLVTKDPDGAFMLQSYGRHAFRLFPGFQFLTEHVEYFNRHSLTGLPEKFMGRIGELRGCEPVTEIMGTMANIERMIRESEEYFVFITKETLATAHAINLSREALDRGIIERGIELTSYVRPDDIVKGVPKETWDATHVHRTNGLLKNRYLEEIDVTIYMNEKEVAILAFPDEQGGFDYLGFTSEDQKIHDWCLELFNHYWDDAIPWEKHVGYPRY